MNKTFANNHKILEITSSSFSDFSLILLLTSLLLLISLLLFSIIGFGIKSILIGVFKASELEIKFDKI